MGFRGDDHGKRGKGGHLLICLFLLSLTTLFWFYRDVPLPYPLLTSYSRFLSLSLSLGMIFLKKTVFVNV